MRQAQYAVIRYIADPGRNEALNIGIIVWDEHSYRVRIDLKAAERVVNQSRWLAKDALVIIEPALRERIGENGHFRPDKIIRLIDHQKGYPMAITDPLMTVLWEEDAEPLDGALERLIRRIVRPRTGGGESRSDPRAVFAKRFDPLIKQHLVTPQHTFPRCHSGLPRRVDFFANSKANVVLDTLNLAITRADNIWLRADARANVINDVVAVYPSVHFIVYIDVLPADELHDTYQAASQILQATGADVSSNIDEAADQFVAAVH